MQKVTTDQLQTEVHKWQEAAKEAAIRASVFADTCADAYLISAGYKQTNNVKSKMASMMNCIKGVPELQH